MPVTQLMQRGLLTQYSNRLQLTILKKKGESMNYLVIRTKVSYINWFFIICMLIT